MIPVQVQEFVEEVAAAPAASVPGTGPRAPRRGEVEAVLAVAAAGLRGGGDERRVKGGGSAKRQSSLRLGKKRIFKRDGWRRGEGEMSGSL